MRRLVQYGSKLLSWLLEVEALRPELVSKLRELETAISTARKRECLHCIGRKLSISANRAVSNLASLWQTVIADLFSSLTYCSVPARKEC